MKIIPVANRTTLSAWHQEKMLEKGAFYYVQDIGMLYSQAPGGGGFIQQTREYLDCVFPGDRLFQLRATFGLPLGDALAAITNLGHAVGWVDFIQEARNNGWWDFQIVEAVEQAWMDADLPRRILDETIKRMKIWIMANPLERVA